MRKKRILWVSEASPLATGFSTLSLGILERLYATGKYEIAEYGSYMHSDDPRAQSLPWQFYGSIPDEDDRLGTERYNSSVYGQFGEALFEQVCLDFKPDIVCVPPDELVMTDHGYQPIQSIKSGDTVLTHTGLFRPVLKIMRRQHEGKLYNIYFNGCCDPIKVTAEHPVLVYRKQKQTNQKKSIKEIYSGLNPEFVPAKDIKEGDLVVLPNNVQTHIPSITISDFIDQFVYDNNNNTIRSTYNDRHINNLIDLTFNFGKLIGYIIGDGYITDSGFNITFGGNEQRFVDDSVTIIKNVFGIDAKVEQESRGKDAIIVRVNSVILQEFLSKWLGRTSNKNIPKEIILGNIEVKKGIISGLIRADGCYKTNTVSFTSVYKKLAYDVRFLCSSMNIPVSINHCGKAYNVEAYGVNAVKLHEIALKHNHIEATNDLSIGKHPYRTHSINNHIVASIRRIRTTDYIGQVYNLEVDQDNSYVLQTCVHNCDIRDQWMSSAWQLKSPYLKYFKYVLMPTVDGEPQKAEWLDDYSRVDLLLTYSRYGKEVLSREAPHLKVFDIVRPGVDHQVFVPKGKEKLREAYGIPKNARIIMTTMRNQRRKLFPDLIENFAEYIRYCIKQGNYELAYNSYLLLHTSYPDVGFDISRHIMQNGVGHRVLVTYRCEKCQLHYIDHFQTELTICPRCESLASHMPNTNSGVSREELCNILNLADLYVQYSICEGLSCTLAEAKSCGIPSMAIDYTATAEQVEIDGCQPIKVSKFFHEPVIETEQRRALPDTQDTVKKFYNFFTLSSQEHKRMSELVRIDAAENYSFDRAAKIFERAFDSLDIIDHGKTWDNPTPNIITIPKAIPRFINNAEFIDWCIENFLGDNKLKTTHWRNELIKALNVGYNMSRGGREKFGPKEALEMFTKMTKNINFWEQIRTKPFRKQDNSVKWELI
jgi:glycosyltransferase involved in cell wall biosynthesis